MDNMDINQTGKESITWCDESTKLLLDRYEEYLPLVGPMKRFKCKKSMWIQIAKEIETKMMISRSAVQCENRYKTILKRKVLSVKNNQQSGAKRVKIEFEEELNKIKAIDDSLEPEILQGPGRIVEKSVASVSNNSQAQKKKTMSISETLLEIQKDKEEKRERRHQEKLDLLRTILTSFPHSNSKNNE